MTSKVMDVPFSVNGVPRVATNAPVALVAVLGELGETVCLTSA